MNYIENGLLLPFSHACVRFFGFCQSPLAYISGTIGLLHAVQKFMSEDANFVGIDFDPFSGL